MSLVPLLIFRPIDADDFRQNGDNASEFSNLVENGLVRITLPLPPNVRLLDPMTGQPTDETSVDLFRAVMPLFNVAITRPDDVPPIWPPAPRPSIMGVDPNGPNRQGGYQHDARFGSLQEQARGALIAHAQVTQEPLPALLDDLAAFQRTLFSSPGVEHLAAAMAAGSTTLPDPDPELNELELQGKAVFNRACAQCHGGSLHPSGSTPDVTLVRPIIRYHNIQSACPRSPVATDGFLACPLRLARNARTYRIRLVNGTTQTFTTSDPGRLLLTGQMGDLGVMDVTQLRGISKTAPYFHNNSAAMLEQVLDPLRVARKGGASENGLRRVEACGPARISGSTLWQLQGMPGPADPSGERHLRRALAEYVVQHHRKRNYQGLANELIDAEDRQHGGRVRRLQRLGGLLSY